MRRTVVIAGLLAAPVLPLATAAPASAVDNVICVAPASVGCNQTFSTIPLAIAAANANALDDTILLGAATYADGPYTLSGTAHVLTLEGAGQGSTNLTLPTPAGAQGYISASHPAVRDLTVKMTAAGSLNDAGVVLGN